MQLQMQLKKSQEQASNKFDNKRVGLSLLGNFGGLAEAMQRRRQQGISEGLAETFALTFVDGEATQE